MVKEKDENGIPTGDCYTLPVPDYGAMIMEMNG